MKFIADSMLGRLAKWLRLLGYDTLYHPHIEDRKLLRIAREDKRILLTRDTQLVKIRGLQEFLLLTDNNTFHQLKKVIETFKLKVYSKKNSCDYTVNVSRCSLCNARLDIIRKGDVKNAVPAYVFQTSHIFKKCSQCGKLYWRGTHPEKLKEKLSEILKN
jgi:uncharacterized protein with PIN domain